MIETIDAEIQLGKNKYGFKEVQGALKEFLKMGREVKNRIKC